MTSITHAPAGAYPTHSAIERELGSGIRHTCVETSPGLYWCRLELPESRFFRSWVCCPGSSPHIALRNAIVQAKRHIMPAY